MGGEDARTGPRPEGGPHRQAGTCVEDPAAGRVAGRPRGPNRARRQHRVSARGRKRRRRAQRADRSAPVDRHQRPGRVRGPAEHGSKVPCGVERDRPAAHRRCPHKKDALLDAGRPGRRRARGPGGQPPPHPQDRASVPMRGDNARGPWGRRSRPPMSAPCPACSSASPRCRARRRTRSIITRGLALRCARLVACSLFVLYECQQYRHAC